MTAAPGACCGASGSTRPNWIANQHGTNLARRQNAAKFRAMRLAALALLLAVAAADFNPYQKLSTAYATSIAAFTIDGDTFLVGCSRRSLTCAPFPRSGAYAD